MKIFHLTLLGFCLVTSLPAQGPADDLPITKRTAAELDELLGPIALYPDALISLILPASTAPMDIVLAARFVASDGDPTRTEDKSWDSSVKALTRYPDTLKWLDENLEWTAQVGDAFIQQPVEVMESIQHLRTMARAMGNLVDTPQQRIVQDETYIRIIPAQPDYIYEPRYDPEIIYYERPLSGPLLFFSLGFGIGSWLNYDFDWHRHRLYRGDWHEGWDYNRDSDRRNREDYFYINNNITNSRQWQPDPVRHRRQSNYVSERISNDVNSSSRTQSRDLRASEPLTADKKGGIVGRTQSSDPVVSESRKHHAGIARPKPIVGSPQHADGVKRTELSERSKSGKESSARTAQESNSGDGAKGRVATPKSVAPGTADEKSKDDKESSARTAQESKSGDGAKGRVATPKSVAPGTADEKSKDDKESSARKSQENKSGDGAKGRVATPKSVAPGMADEKNKDGKESSARKSQENKSEDGAKGRVAMPKSVAPGMAGDSKQGSDARDHKKPVNETTSVTSRVEAPSKKEAEAKINRKTDKDKDKESMRKESSKQDTPRQGIPKQEAPKQAESKREEPKREAKKPTAPKQAESRREEPKREAKKPDAPKQIVSKQDTLKRPEAAKSREAPKKEVAKTPAEPAKEKAKTDAKKKAEEEEEKKKKKKS